MFENLHFFSPSFSSFLIMLAPQPQFYLFASKRGEYEGNRRQPNQPKWDELKKAECLDLVWKPIWNIIPKDWLDKYVQGSFGMYMSCSRTNLGKYILNYWEKHFAARLYSLSIVFLISNPLFGELLKMRQKSSKWIEIRHLHWHIIILMGYMLGMNKLLACSREFCSLKHQKLFNTDV